jgi:hypothetical protein
MIHFDLLFQFAIDEVVKTSDRYCRGDAVGMEKKGYCRSPFTQVRLRFVIKCPFALERNRVTELMQLGWIGACADTAGMEQQPEILHP